MQIRLLKILNSLLSDKEKLKSECPGLNEAELVRKYEEIINISKIIDQIEADDLARVDNLTKQATVKAVQEKNKKKTDVEELEDIRHKICLLSGLQLSGDNQCAGQMNHPQVILCFTKIASPNRPKAFQPSNSPFDDPAPCGMGFVPVRDLFLTDAANMGNVGMGFQLFFDAGVVVPLV
jgi:hypothetical protein